MCEHEPYPSYYYPSCWKCGQTIYEEEYKKFLQDFDKICPNHISPILKEYIYGK